MDSEAQNALLDAARGVAADAAAEDAPLADRVTTVAFSAADDSTRSRVRQTDAGSGAYLGGWTTSAPTDAAFRALRDRMFRPGEGTWYWMLLEIGPAGEVDARFFHDEPPAWERLDLAVQASAYRADLQRYPRPPARVPDWLTRLLADAGEAGP